MAEAFVSLTTNDDYANGAYVLGKSLKLSGTTRKCILMVTSGVSTEVRNRLNQYWDELVDITALDSDDQERLAILARPELGCTFTKLRAWTLTRFSKAVFLDADTMVLQNVDDLFERRELSAAPDVGWPDCFNSGVFVFEPNMDTYGKLLQFARTRGSFDGGDQGLLNDFFNDWAIKDITRRLPFVYNMVANITYSYTPAFMRYGQDVKIVHFLGAVKPWHYTYDESTGQVKRIGTSQSISDDIFAKMWWDLNRSSGDSGSMASGSSVSQSWPSSWKRWDEARVVYATRREQWEKGTPDYNNEDKFDNILSHMQAMMVATKPTSSDTAKPVTSKTTSKVSESMDTTDEKSVVKKSTKDS